MWANSILERKVSTLYNPLHRTARARIHSENAILKRTYPLTDSQPIITLPTHHSPHHLLRPRALRATAPQAAHRKRTEPRALPHVPPAELHRRGVRRHHPPGDYARAQRGVWESGFCVGCSQR